MEESTDLGNWQVEWADHTTLHPLGACAIVILGAFLLILPRRHATLPLIIMACFVAPAQRIVIASLDFNLLRIMVLFGIVRVLVRAEIRDFVWTSTDWILVLWSISTIVMYTLHDWTTAALINRLGYAFDAVGMYFLFRILVRSWDDLRQTVYAFVLTSIPVAGAFFIESATGRNLFSIFGGVPEITMVRDGRLRCQGAFSHPILAGCFWATVIPVMAVDAWTRSSGRMMRLLGLTASGLIIMLCASSTPLMSIVFGIIAASLFPLRREMRVVRWCIALSLLTLHLVMKAPVWHLLARVNVVGGSTGWHRYQVIDAAIEHFSEWWLLGVRTISHWNVFANDITNQFVAEGINGGLITLLLFISLIVSSFGSVGRIWRQASSSGEVLLAWSLGVALFMHCMNFLGVTYFGQITMAWYWLLATIASLSVRVRPHRGGGRRSSHSTTPRVVEEIAPGPQCVPLT